MSEYCQGISYDLMHARSKNLLLASEVSVYSLFFITGTETLDAASDRDLVIGTFQDI